MANRKKKTLKLKLTVLLTDVLSPAAIELRFMPDPPTLSTQAVQHINKSDDLELTCRYPFLHASGLSQTHASIVITIYFLFPFPGQRSAVPEMVDSSDEYPLLHLRLQRLGPVLHYTAHLKRHR